ncbi:nucleotide sugar dehydrogenase [Bacillus aquiflavi]|uniref:Nucleotide sugar dehydrogenase n=1 Tax=Bacillus aquiflavi TaxID=2672567 RepID=A0A6B3W3A5_9BACI|nr:nucleotide sugar dehydrogenase [Bacillus aquiflavi]MBA4538052.1 nucleotide sugar dehydrogenase [Bacillus aquiflavi]NEY82351.1 nucleotide sugar dehydrogenase [Bacillus aquiflavi]UAC47868.1 nucleotide sugar dehydrogenase [Bacillus aquiflavi]
MSLYQELLNKIETKEAVIGVVGLGYVGLPLAVEKAKAGFKVIGFDIQPQRVDWVNEGHNYIGDVVDEDLKEVVKNGLLKATTDYNQINEIDAVAICVPTPLDLYMQPDTSYVRSSSQEIAKYVKEGTLVVLESTTYPGTTEEIIRPEFEKKGFKVGENIFIAYSPERVDPGNKQFKTKNTPKVVGGITDKCTKVASSLYRSVLAGDVHEVTSPAVAEMEKIFENTFRHLNIALANEMAILCDKMGIDVWEVIDAAKTKPYGFMAFYPGPGLGGHCIPIDPFYLTWKAREYNYHTRLIELAGEINNSMPEYVVNKTMEILNSKGKTVQNASILVYGVAYKKDIDDVRESPSLPILSMLNKLGAKTLAIDPYVKSFKLDGQVIYTVNSDEVNLNEADLALILTDHSDVDYKKIYESNITIYDTKNALGMFEEPGKYYKL